MAEEFDPEKAAADVKKALEDSLEVAERVKDPTPVPTVKRKQLGQDILVAKCPHCGTVAALAGPGKHLCRGCHNWLLYTTD